MEISAPCRIATPQNFIVKLGTRDYVRGITHMQISGQIGSAGSSCQTVKYNTFATFLTVLIIIIFLNPLHRSNRGPSAHT